MAKTPPSTTSPFWDHRHCHRRCSGRHPVGLYKTYHSPLLNAIDTLSTFSTPRPSSSDDPPQLKCLKHTHTHPLLPASCICAMAIFGRKARNQEAVNEPTPRHSGSTLAENGTPEKSILKRATKTRKIWCGITAFLLLISVVFLILVEIGNTSNRGALKDFYFIKLNVANVFPASIPNASLLNSIAQTLGLHDFYQVGLWNYCEGYNDSRGVTSCANPQTLYWFNPVAIIASELVAGASSMYLKSTRIGSSNY
jgi:hypothetical protein